MKTSTLALASLLTIAATGCIFSTHSSDADMRAYAAKLQAASEGTEHAIQPPPVVSFPQGQAALEVASKDWGAGHNPPYAMMRNYVVGRDWDMERAPSGRILDREVETVSYYQGGPNNYCFRNRGYVKQEEQGGRWGRPYMQWEAMKFRVNCQQVESLPAASSGS